MRSLDDKVTIVFHDTMGETMSITLGECYEWVDELIRTLCNIDEPIEERLQRAIDMLN